MAKKMRRKCYFCSEPMTGRVERYKPDEMNGRYVFCCPECAEEARRGKFGAGGRYYRPVNTYFKGMEVRA